MSRQPGNISTGNAAVTVALGNKYTVKKEKEYLAEMNEVSAAAHHLLRLLTNRHGFFAIFNVPVPGPAYSDPPLQYDYCYSA